MFRFAYNRLLQMTHDGPLSTIPDVLVNFMDSFTRQSYAVVVVVVVVVVESIILHNRPKPSAVSTSLLRLT